MCDVYFQAGKEAYEVNLISSTSSMCSIPPETRHDIDQFSKVSPEMVARGKGQLSARWVMVSNGIIYTEFATGLSPCLYYLLPLSGL